MHLRVDLAAASGMQPRAFQTPALITHASTILFLTQPPCSSWRNWARRLVRSPASAALHVRVAALQQH